MRQDQIDYKRTKKLATLANDLLKFTREYTDWKSGEEPNLETAQEIVDVLEDILLRMSSESESKRERNRANTLLKKLREQKDIIGYEIRDHHTRSSNNFDVRIGESDSFPIIDDSALKKLVSILNEYIEEDGTIPEIIIANAVNHGEQSNTDFDYEVRYGSDFGPLTELPMFIRKRLGDKAIELIEDQHKFWKEDSEGLPIFNDEEVFIFDEKMLPEWKEYIEAAYPKPIDYDQYNYPLVISCGSGKVDVTSKDGTINAYKLYDDATLWGVFRKNSPQVPMKDIPTYVMSAEFGLIPHTKKIPTYDKVIVDKAKAKKGEITVSDMAQKLRDQNWEDKQKVLFAGSSAYRKALEQAGFEVIPLHEMKDYPGKDSRDGIGKHRGGLAWFLKTIAPKLIAEKNRRSDQVAQLVISNLANRFSNTKYIKTSGDTWYEKFGEYGDDPTKGKRKKKKSKIFKLPKLSYNTIFQARVMLEDMFANAEEKNYNTYVFQSIYGVPSPLEFLQVINNDHPTLSSWEYEDWAENQGTTIDAMVREFLNNEWAIPRVLADGTKISDNTRLRILNILYDYVMKAYEFDLGESSYMYDETKDVDKIDLSQLVDKKYRPAWTAMGRLYRLGLSKRLSSEKRNEQTSAYVKNIKRVLKGKNSKKKQELEISYIFGDYKSDMQMWTKQVAAAECNLVDCLIRKIDIKKRRKRGESCEKFLKRTSKLQKEIQDKLHYCQTVDISDVSCEEYMKLAQCDNLAEILKRIQDREPKDRNWELSPSDGLVVLGLADYLTGANRLKIQSVSKEEARKFVKKHHSALPEINMKGIMLAIGAIDKNGKLVAVATVNTPTGRWDLSKDRGDNFDSKNVIELTRVASDGSVKNASSILTARIIDLLPDLLRGDPGKDSLFVTYSLDSEEGTTYKALKDKGLRPTVYIKGKKKGGAREGGDLSVSLGDIDKIRWEAGSAAMDGNWDLLELVGK